MKRILSFVAVGLLLSAGMYTLLANDLYISGSGSGTDCSMLLPCTFATAQGKAVAGDVIHIKDRVQAINVTKSGITLEGGIVDGSNNTDQDSAAILVTGDNVTIKNVEVINGHSYGIRTYNIGYGKNLTIDGANIHHNVLENFYGSFGCNQNVSSGWGSAVRAYRTTGMTVRNSSIYENCGEGLSSVMSDHTTGSNLQIWDNFSVNVYPDQSQYFTVTDSVVQCLKPEYQRFGLSFALLLGAESYSGISTNTTDFIDFERNKVYNCKGVGVYSTTGNTWKDITVINNEFYNVPSPAIASISGTNIVTSPNLIANYTLTPSQTGAATITRTITATSTTASTQTPAPPTQPSRTSTPTGIVTPKVTATAMTSRTNTVTPIRTPTGTQIQTQTPKPTRTHRPTRTPRP